MRTYILFSIILLLVASCSVFNHKPKGIIDDDKLVDILVDIHLADGTLAVAGYNINKDSTKIELLYQDVLNKHNITQQEFEKTIDFYSDDPHHLESIYEQVSEKLAKIESKFDEGYKEKEKVKG